MIESFAGDHLPRMVFFVDPNQEVLGIIVPNASCVRPVTGHSSRCQEWRDRFVEEKMFFDQLILNLFSHASQRIVLTFKENILKCIADELTLFTNTHVHFHQPVVLSNWIAELLLSHSLYFSFFFAHTSRNVI